MVLKRQTQDFVGGKIDIVAELFQWLLIVFAISSFIFLLATASASMLSAPLNPNLQKQMVKGLQAAFKNHDSEMFVSFDFDNVRYHIEASEERLVFSFFCEDFKAIWEYSGSYLKSKYYPEFEVKVPGEKNLSLSIVVDQTALGKINLSGSELIVAVADRFATFRRNFFAAPIEMMMNALLEDKPTTIGNLCYSLRPNEKTWLIYNSKFPRDVGVQKNMTVYFGISFNEKSEQQIVRILLTELTEVKKHVNNSPIVEVSESELSKYLIDAFPQEKNNKYGFTNGITSFTFFAKTLSNVSKQASLLAGFRQYVQYHCQASKCNLHTRVINRIEQFYKVPEVLSQSIVLSKFEESTLEYSSSAM